MAKISRYGLDWDMAHWDDAQIELEMIRRGQNLFQHHKRFQQLVWPKDHHHRWTDLSLSRICDNEITVMLGSGDSGKSYSAAKFILTTYWANPDKTLWMVSSTELRGAELRIWGAIKGLFNRARERYPALAGNVIDSKHCITTDQISEDQSEARLLTRGVIFIPCKVGNQYIGMGCFPEGQPVDTPFGSRPIESIRKGDVVIGACGPAKVNRTSVRTAKTLVRLTLNDGRSIECTPEHPILTGSGWKNAVDIPPHSHVISPDESMSILRKTIPEALENPKVLFASVHVRRSPKEMCPMWERVHPIRSEEYRMLEVLRRDMEMAAAENKREISEVGQNRNGKNCQRLDHVQSSREAKKERVNEVNGRKTGVVEGTTVLQWGLRSNTGRRIDAFGVSRSTQRVCGKNRQEFQMGQNRTALFIGLSMAGNKAGRGTRRKLPQFSDPKTQGCTEGQFSFKSRVVRVEVLQQRGDSSHREGCGEHKVYNLEIEGHPSYSVNGILVHNSYAGIKPPADGFLGHCGDEVSFMQRNFLDAYSNWYGKENFKGIMLANPFDLEDPSCVAAEPVNGWDSWVDTGKTQEWRSKFYNAWVIAFDGRDSPNFDPPVGEKPRFPYLVGPKKIEAVAATHGDESWQFYNQCVGKPRAQAHLRRVITKTLCDQHKAFDDVIWDGSHPIVKVAALDAAYGGVGGDRCVTGHIEFGRDINGDWILAQNPVAIVPVSVRNPEEPEIQIARFCKTYCERADIPARNFFFDARSTLAVRLAQEWSADVNAVDFGGSPSSRPVSLDEYIWDGEEKTKRLKLCNEHYSKFVTELWFTIYYLIIGDQMRRLQKEVAKEGYQREWKYTKNNKIEVESKADMKERTTQSPDLFDFLVTAVEGARRLGFQIKKVGNREDDYEDKSWLNDLKKRAENLRDRRNLVFSR